MPRVPTYDQFTVSPSDAPTPRVSTPDVPLTAGKTALNIGEGMSRAANAVSTLTDKLTEEADQLLLIDATNQATKVKLNLTYDKKNGFLNYKGKAALDGIDEDGVKRPLDQAYDERFVSQMEWISQNTLKTDRQRQLFRQTAAQLRTQLASGVNQHMAAEYKEFQTDTHNGTILTATDSMSLDWGNKKNLADQRNQITGAVMERDKDLPEDLRKANLVKALSPGNTAVIKGAIDAKNIDYAKEQFEANKAFLTPASRLELEGAFKLNDTLTETQTLTEDILGKSKGNQVEALRLARTTLSGEKEKAVVEELRDRFNEESIMTKREMEKRKDAAWEAYNKTHSIKSIPTSVLAAMDPTDRAHLEEYASNKIYQGMVRANAAEERNLRQQHRAAAPEYLRIVSDADKLADMSPNDILALEPKLGVEYTQSLLNKREQLQNREGKLTAHMDTSQFNEVAASFGFNPYAPHPTQEQKEALGLVRSRVDTQLELAAKRKKAPLSREEKDAIMRESMKAEVEIDGFFSNKKVPAIAVTATQMKRVIVPPSDKAMIIDALKQSYKSNPRPENEPTEDNIRRVYIEGQKR